MNGQKRLIILITGLLAIPLVAFLVASVLQWKPNLAPHDVRNGGMAGVYQVNDDLQRMKHGAITVAGAGVLMLIAIRIAGLTARKRRTLLLFLFAPGLHLTMLIMSCLIVAHAVLAIASIYYCGISHGRIIFGMGLAAFWGVLTLIQAQFSTIDKATTRAIGKRLDRTNFARLWSFVEELADRMGAQRPDSIIAGLEPNFYVTESEVTCVDGDLSGKTMYLSLPLCRTLSIDEFGAVIGHELGHYKGIDTKFSQRFYPIYRGASQGMSDLSEAFSGKDNGANVVLLPAFVVLSYFLDCFSAAEREISREREIAADTEAARAVSSLSMARALVKVHALSGAWGAVRTHMKKVIEGGKIVINASALFGTFVANLVESGAISEIPQSGPLHPTDTHPPLSKRLENLHFRVGKLAGSGFNAKPEHPAIELFDNAEDLEEELSKIEQTEMIQSGIAKLPPESIPATSTV